MSETLAQFYRFHLWANQQILDFCSTLTDEQLDTAYPGTGGSVRKLLFHILANEEGYLQEFTHQSPETPLRSLPQPISFDELKRRAEWTGQRFLQLADTLPDGHMFHGTFNNEEYAMPAYIPMIQCIHHGIEHRAQIKSTLSQLGLQPPELDAWMYGTELGF